MKQRAIEMVKKSLQNELISGSLFIFIGSMAGSFLAFLFNFFVVHNIKSADYGTYASLISLINLVAIPSQSFVTIIVQFATEYFAKKQTGKALQLYSSLFKFTAVLGLVTFLGFVLFSIPIGQFFHITNLWFLLIAAITIAIMYLGIVNNAFATSLLKFGFLSWLQALAGLIKIAGALLLFLIGYNVFGALSVVFMSAFIPFFLGFIPILPLFRQHTDRIQIHYGELLHYAIPATFATLAVSSFTSSDLLLAKHYFPAHEAGLYAGLTLVGRVIFYFTGTIPLVMFPLIIKRYNLQQNYKNIFHLSLCIIVIPSLLLTAFYFLFPGFTVHFFLGKEYNAVIPYVGLIALYMTIFSTVNLFVTFFLSIKRTSITYIVTFAAILQIAGIILFHRSFQQIISVDLLVSVLLLIILLLYYFRTYGKK